MSLVVVASLPEFCPVCDGAQRMRVVALDGIAVVDARVTCPHCTTPRLPVALSTRRDLPRGASA
jgi:hypothetical protein